MMESEGSSGKLNSQRKDPGQDRNLVSDLEKAYSIIERS